MATKSKAWRQKRIEARTHKRQAKRRAVRNAYKPRTTGFRAYKRESRSEPYRQARWAVDFALLHHFLMGRAA